MKIIDTKIADVKILEPAVFKDERGEFSETWNSATLAAHGIDVDFVQDNQSISSKGTLRGIHFQKDHPQGKLVRVNCGEVYDVAVDLRENSPSFGEWVGVYLTAENKRQLWIPPGFGHGFYAMADNTMFSYKCTDYYYPDDQHCLMWDDPSLWIDWPIIRGVGVHVSPKDAEGKQFEDMYEKITT